MMGPNERLEKSQWDFFWIPEGVEVLDRPEVAALRSAERVPHLNIVTRTRAAPEQLGDLVAEVWAWIGHDEARWVVTDTRDPRPLERELTAAGWKPMATYEARAIGPSRYAREAPRGLTVRRVETLAGLRDCISVMSQAFGRDLSKPDAALESELAQCRSRRGRTHRYVVYDGDAPIGSGGFNHYPELRLAFLWAGGTVPGARGRGAYTALVARRVSDAAALGVEWVGLYAKEDTSAPIVTAQGFERFGQMRYWAAPGAAPPAS